MTFAQAPPLRGRRRGSPMKRFRLRDHPRRTPPDTRPCAACGFTSRIRLGDNLGPFCPHYGGNRSLTRLRRFRTALSAWSPFALQRVPDRDRIKPEPLGGYPPPRAVTDRVPPARTAPLLGSRRPADNNPSTAPPTRSTSGDPRNIPAPRRLHVRTCGSASSVKPPMRIPEDEASKSSELRHAAPMIMRDWRLKRTAIKVAIIVTLASLALVPLG